MDKHIKAITHLLRQAQAEIAELVKEKNFLIDDRDMRGEKIGQLYKEIDRLQEIAKKHRDRADKAELVLGITKTAAAGAIALQKELRHKAEADRDGALESIKALEARLASEPGKVTAAYYIDTAAIEKAGVSFVKPDKDGITLHIERNAAFDAEQDAARDQIRAKDEADRLRAEIAQLKEQIAAEREKADNLQALYSTEKRNAAIFRAQAEKYGALEADHEAALEAEAQLKEQIADLSETVRDRQELIERYQTELANRIKRSEAKQEEYREVFDEYKRQIGIERENADHLRARLVTAEAEIAKLKGKLEAALSELKTAKDNADYMLEKKREIEQRAAHLEAMLKREYENRRDF